MTTAAAYQEEHCRLLLKNESEFRAAATQQQHLASYDSGYDSGYDSSYDSGTKSGTNSGTDSGTDFGTDFCTDFGYDSTYKHQSIARHSGNVYHYQIRRTVFY